MHGVVIRDVLSSDFAAICGLNLAELQHTSPMDTRRLAYLTELSCYRKVACIRDSVVAFLIAMRHDAPYDNENFAWFGRRFPQFLYIDRIIVSPECRGLRVGASLYEDLFRYARDHAIPVVTCEYNIAPPNEPSRAFHDSFGFKEQGTQWIVQGSKQVSMQALVQQPNESG
jgi:uncharacterized protein